MSKAELNAEIQQLVEWMVLRPAMRDIRAKQIEGTCTVLIIWKSLTNVMRVVFNGKKVNERCKRPPCYQLLEKLASAFAGRKQCYTVSGTTGTGFTIWGRINMFSVWWRCTVRESSTRSTWVGVDLYFGPEAKWTILASFGEKEPELRQEIARICAGKQGYRVFFEGLILE
jgi:hypothetical protein